MKKALITEIRENFLKKPVGAFDIIGKLKTVEEPRKVFCGTTVKNVRIEIHC